MVKSKKLEPVQGSIYLTYDTDPGVTNIVPRVRFMGILPLIIYIRVLSYLIPEMLWRRLEYHEQNAVGTMGGEVRTFTIHITPFRIYADPVCHDQIMGWYNKGRGNELIRILYHEQDTGTIEKGI